MKPIGHAWGIALLFPLLSGCAIEFVNPGLRNRAQGATLEAAVMAVSGFPLVAKGGALHSIALDLPDDTVSGQLEYTVDGGTSYLPIAAVTSGQTSQAWTFPSLDVSGVRVRLTVTRPGGVIEQTLSDSFAIDSTLPAVLLTSLGGGQYLSGGGAVNILWTASDTHLLAAPITLEYSSNGGGSWSAIASAQANSGTYSWTVPGVNLATARVRVRAMDAAGNEALSASASNFTIDSTNPVVTLTSLLGGQSILGGTPVAITWTAATDTNLAANPISLDYSADAGSTWVAIATGEANDGTYSWTPPAGATVTTMRVRVRAVDLAGRLGSSASSSNFTVNKPAFILAGFRSYGGGDLFLATGDIDGDGNLDLVGNERNADRLRLYKGDGNGNIAAPTANLTTRSEPTGVVVGNFNSDIDSLPDVAYIHKSMTGLSVNLNNGAGGFGARTDFSFSTQDNFFLKSGDFNGDGKLDLVATTIGSDGDSLDNDVGVYIAMGNGLGSFSITPVIFPDSDGPQGQSPFGVGVGDMNGDGKLDFVTASNWFSRVLTFLGDGLGTAAGFTQVTPATATGASSQPMHVEIGDYNGDGKLDFATNDSALNRVRVYLGNGDGTYGGAPVNLPTLDRPRGLVSGDFNGDGNLDLVATTENADRLHLWFGNGAGAFSTRQDYVTGPSPGNIVTGDFNGDGKLDVAFSEKAAGTARVVVWVNNL